MTSIAPIFVPKNNITSNDINGRQSINPFSGRSSRQSRYESPLERMFCDFINRDTHYDICVIDCQSNWRGEVQECTETVWEKKCGCNQGPPKSVGIMKYRVSPFIICCVLFIMNTINISIVFIYTVRKRYFTLHISEWKIDK